MSGRIITLLAAANLKVAVTPEAEKAATAEGAAEDQRAQCLPDSLRDETAVAAQAVIERRPLAFGLRGHLGGGGVAAGGGGGKGSAESAQEESDDDGGAGSEQEGGSAHCGSAARVGRKGRVGQTEEPRGRERVSSIRRQNEIELEFILAFVRGRFSNLISILPNVLLSSNRDISCRFLDAYYKQFTDRTGDTGGVSIGGSGGGRTDSDVAVALSTPLFPDAIPSASLAANGAAAAGISTLGRAIAGLNKSDSADVLNSFDPEAILTPGIHSSSN